jgi:hypothetical protein
MSSEHPIPQADDTAAGGEPSESAAEQLATLQRELAATRTRLQECEEKLAWRRGHDLAAIFDHLANGN